MDSDDVIVGERAKAWHNAIGPYGDPLRMILVNRLVARALNQFGREGRGQRITETQTLIQEWIGTLPVSAVGKVEDLAKQLTAGHADADSLLAELPSISGTSLLDLGAGNGYLGGWLQSLGVRYTGVEPSRDLNAQARKDPRLAGAELFETTIHEFCRDDLYPYDEPPTLITLIGVIDHLSDPETSLRALNEFLAARDWLHVPVLVATFDPDFFLPGLPERDRERQTSAFYGLTENLSVRDPAIWEELFANSSFHVLEQRPLHISGLPDALSNHLQTLHEEVFELGRAGTYRSHDVAAQAGKARVPPRQGPFYFWLLCPRVASCHALTYGAAAPEANPRQVESFKTQEVLAVVGNLGARIYRVVEGSAYFSSAETGRMDFGPETLFGQLESACNYVSSRVLGDLMVAPGSQLETMESRQLLHQLVQSQKLPDQLFLSLLRHLASVQFVPFVSAKRADERLSKVLTSRKYNWRLVRNVAASLLHASANAVSSLPSGSYRSRVVIELGRDEICSFVYGPNYNREGANLIEVIPALVQSNVIDSFSCYLLDATGTQDNVSEIGDVSDQTFSPLNIGWQAARFVEHQFPPLDGEGSVKDSYPLALAISAILDSRGAREALKDELSSGNDSERRDRRQAGRTERAATRAVPKSQLELQDYAIGLVDCPEAQRDQLRKFLTTVAKAFGNQKAKDFSEKHGLSSFIVVRDLWALMACLLDRETMWKSSVKEVGPFQYVTQPNQRPRIIAYIQECIAHAGRQAGFDDSPW